MGAVMRLMDTVECGILNQMVETVMGKNEEQKGDCSIPRCEGRPDGAFARICHRNENVLYPYRSLG